MKMKCDLFITKAETKTQRNIHCIAQKMPLYVKLQDWQLSVTLLYAYFFNLENSKENQPISIWMLQSVVIISFSFALAMIQVDLCELRPQ